MPRAQQTPDANCPFEPTTAEMEKQDKELTELRQIKAKLHAIGHELEVPLLSAAEIIETSYGDDLHGFSGVPALATTNTLRFLATFLHQVGRAVGDEIERRDAQDM